MSQPKAYIVPLKDRTKHARVTINLYNSLKDRTFSDVSGSSVVLTGYSWFDSVSPR
jgi:hypothetical protein